MQKQTGELKEIGTWWSNPRSVMEGYIEYIKVGDTRIRKVGCAADLADFLSQIDAGTPITLYLHKFLFTTNLILGVKNEETGDKISFHVPSLVVMMIKTFFLLAILSLIFLGIVISVFIPRTTMGFMPVVYMALLMAGALIFLQVRAFMQAKAAI